jgi:hypothetical protein
MRKLSRTAEILILVTGFTAACERKLVSVPPPAASEQYQGILGKDSLQESLFKGDQEVLSNADIERILTSRVTLGDRHRLAILSLTPHPLWSQELADLDAQNSDRFLKTLGSSSQLSEVKLMPTLLIPEKRTVPYLREAAARFQADLLFVYSTRIQTFQQNRVIGPDEVRAVCLAESVLLDVRTGIVAHTSRAIENISAKKVPGDLNFSETVAKAQTEATGKAIVKLAEAAVVYLKDGK